MSKLKLEFINEFQIDSSTSREINVLLTKCFPGTDYNGRDYFKQLCHYRILARIDHSIIAQLGIDFRAMNLNGEAIRVFGVVDLCVDPAFRGKGIGKKLMIEFESIARKHSDRIDFLFLVTDDPKYYEKLGFKQTTVTTTWLKIDQHRNYGLGVEKIEDAFFLIKSVSNKQWKDGDLDLLGYMY